MIRTWGTLFQILEQAGALATNDCKKRPCAEHGADDQEIIGHPPSIGWNGPRSLL